jgi:hypothetical protein
MTVLVEIMEKSKTEFRPASGTEMQTLQTPGMPEDALHFYSSSVPTRAAEIAKIRLWNVGNVVVENTDAVPGYYAHPCGYVVFASTDCGDSYCFDIRCGNYPARAPIVLITHDLEPENDEMSREDLEKVAKTVSSSFGNFLELFASGSLDTKSLHSPFDFGDKKHDTN